MEVACGQPALTLLIQFWTLQGQFACPTPGLLSGLPSKKPP